MAFAKKDRNISLGVYMMIGLAVFLIAFIFYIVASNQKYFDAKYPIYMSLPNVQGLNRGAFITLSGLKIGVVGKMKINNESIPRGVTIELKLDKRYRENITSSSVAMIKTLGILGDKYVDITIGDPAQPVLQPGDFITSDAGVDFYEFVDAATEMVEDFKHVLRNTNLLTSNAVEGKGVLGKLIFDPGTAQKLTKMIDNMSRVSGSLASGQGSLGKMLKDTTLYARLNRSSLNFQSILDSLHSGNGAFAQILRDKTIFPRIKSLSEKTDSLLYRLQHNGTMAKLLNDEQLYKNLVNLTGSLDSLSTDMKKHPGKYVKFSLF